MSISAVNQTQVACVSSGAGRGCIGCRWTPKTSSHIFSAWLRTISLVVAV